jgi:hypothetical protein
MRLFLRELDPPFNNDDDDDGNNDDDDDGNNDDDDDGTDDDILNDSSELLVSLLYNLFKSGDI